MSYYITAIYDHGLLKPLEPLVLPDHSRVRLRVEFDEMPKSSDNSSAESSAAEVVAQRQAMLEVDDEIADLPDLSPHDGFSSGDHDQILYGEAK